MKNSMQSFVHNPHYYVLVTRKYFSSINSRANAPELIENIEEMFPLYYLFNILKHHLLQKV